MKIYLKYRSKIILQNKTTTITDNLKIAKKNYSKSENDGKGLGRRPIFHLKSSGRFNIYIS
jgi:hypothetical protein